MKISLKVIFSFIAILSLITSLTAAEKAAKPLSPGWSFKGFFLVNSTEHHYKGDIKYIQRYVRHAIQ